MTQIRIRNEKYPSTIDFFGTDNELLNLLKTKTKWECRRCHQRIMKGSWCLGGRWRKICFKCAKSFLNDIKASLMMKAIEIQATLDDMNDNQNKYADDNVLANLRENG